MSAIERVTDHVSGGDALETGVIEKLGVATAALETATSEYKEATEADRKETLGKARDVAAREVQSLKDKIDQDRAKADDARNAEIDTLIAEAKGTRAPSKAWLMSGGGQGPASGWTPGQFAYNIYARKSSDFSLTERMKAEQALEEMGISFSKLPETSKGTIGGVEAGGGFILPQRVVEMAAGTLYRERPSEVSSDLQAKATLGLTSATGGVLIPGATVSDLVKPGRYVSAVTRLVDSVQVGAYQTSIPVRVAAPTRASVVPWGDQKTLTNLAYGGYTATMYTLAIIYDVAKQWLKYSRGAAEADVLSELATAFELGRGYYILQGSGSSEPYGIQTAIATAFGAFTSSFTASATTLAGSVATAIATAAGALATRYRTPEAALLAPAAYWTMVAQGTDTAGFFFSPAAGPVGIRPGTLISPFGIPVYSEGQLAGTNDLLVGEFSALDVFYGDAYRVDTSDEAGERWDKNLVGFRGEQEMGLDARPAVYAGAFQFITAAVP